MNIRQFNYQNFFQNLSQEAKKLFKEEAQVAFDWSQSTFYYKIQGARLKRYEIVTLNKMVLRYATQYKIPIYEI